MIDFRNLLKINEKNILSMNVERNPHGLFALEYADARPWFYADGNMIPKTDRVAYRTLESRATDTAILHRMVENGRYMWQFSDMHGTSRGCMPGDEFGPKDTMNVPNCISIPSPEQPQPGDTPMAFDTERALLFPSTVRVVDHIAWVHAYGFIFQFPLLENRIQSRHAEFELFLMDAPRLTTRAYAYLGHYINQMRHIEYSSNHPQTRSDRYDKQQSVLAQTFYAKTNTGR